MKKDLRINIGGIPNRGNVKVPSGKIWPCKEFSLGYAPVEPDERLDDRPAEYTAPGDEGTPAAAPAFDLRNVPNLDNGPQCLVSAGEEGFKKSSRPERYGRKGMTGYGKKMVKSVGALIDKHYPRHRVTFATVTFPELPMQLRRELAQQWPRLVNELMKWLRRRLEKKGLPQVVVSVTEIQLKRLETYGEGYLHLHLLWLNIPAKKGAWAIRVENLKAWLADWLIRKGLWSKDSHVNVDTRSVKGEKARYLAKYASKGSVEIEEFASDCGWDCVPSQWWNVTKHARDWVKANLIEGSEAGRLLDAIINHSFDVGEFSHFRYIYHVDCEIGGKLMTVGWRGAFEDCAYDEVREMLTPE